MTNTLKVIYNTAKIMKRAAALGRYGYTKSASLKQAWLEAKAEVESTRAYYLYQLRYIHAAAVDLGLGREGEAYMGMLESLTGKHSCADMTTQQRDTVIDFLRDEKHNRVHLSLHNRYQAGAKSFEAVGSYSDEDALAVLG